MNRAVSLPDRLYFQPDKLTFEEIKKYIMVIAIKSVQLIQQV